MQGCPAYWWAIAMNSWILSHQFLGSKQIFRFPLVVCFPPTSADMASVTVQRSSWLSYVVALSCLCSGRNGEPPNSMVCWYLFFSIRLSNCRIVEETQLVVWDLTLTCIVTKNLWRLQSEATPLVARRGEDALTNRKHGCQNLGWSTLFFGIHHLQCQIHICV